VATLEDIISREVFALHGAFDEGLVPRQHYYLDGNEESGSLYFHNVIDEVDMQSRFGEVTRGTFTVEGSVITVAHSGVHQIFYLINSYLLESEDGTKFIRVR
jgi:hypothetical protein